MHGTSIFADAGQKWLRLLQKGILTWLSASLLTFSFLVCSLLLPCTLMSLFFLMSSTYVFSAVPIYAAVAANLAERKKVNQLTELFKNIKPFINDDLDEVCM
jgi:hypothetical protein